MTSSSQQKPSIAKRVLEVFLVTVAAGFVAGGLLWIFNLNGNSNEASESVSDSASPTLPVTPSPSVDTGESPLPEEPLADSPTEPAAPVSDLTITEARVEIEESSKIAPGVWRVNRDPGYWTTVFTAAGEVEYRDGCYVHWELYNNDVLVDTSDSKCARQQGYGVSYWPRLSKEIGTMRVVASITTDWGASTVTEFSYEVR
jgi:hypothetical protein